MWALLPFVAILPVPLVFIYQKPNYSILGLIIPIWFVLLLYCSAKSLVNSAVLSRLAFGELISQPENEQTAYNYVNRRIWQFLLLTILSFLLFIAICIALIIFGIIVGVIAASILMVVFGGSIEENELATLVLGLIIIVILLAIISALTWFFSRLMIVDVALAIEPEINAVSAISRSWHLTKGNALRIILILTVGFLITMPIYIITQIADFAVQPIIDIFITQKSPEYFVISYIEVYIIGLLGDLFVLPLWQGITAIIYCDLRSRKEGLGLPLPDRNF
ncbi:MAG: hypothetical protein WBV73_19395 [Phormidium sp.]